MQQNSSNEHINIKGRGLILLNFEKPVFSKVIIFLRNRSRHFSQDGTGCNAPQS
jgi:hypothetical protein